MDAEKAFDRIERGYLKSILHKMGFGSMFMFWINLIYSAQNMAIYKIGRFALYHLCYLIETIARAVWEIQDSCGSWTHLRDHKLMLYADDVFLLQDPVTSFKKINFLLKHFGTASAYKINEVVGNNEAKY